MSEYEIINAGHTVDGYFLPRPNESEQATFDRAKAEAVKNLKQSTQNVETLTLEQFKAKGFQS